MLRQQLLVILRQELVLAASEDFKCSDLLEETLEQTMARAAAVMIEKLTPGNVNPIFHVQLYQV